MPRSPVVTIIIALNLVVFLMWQAPHLVGGPRFMIDNFLVSWTGLRDGRYWTLITSVFSHSAFWHFFINMYVFYSFGRIMEIVLGSRDFAIFYFVAGLVSSFSHAAVSAFLLGQPALPALGASGAVAGVLIIFALSFPREKILLLGIIPLPAIVGALAFIGFDVWGLASQAHGGGLPIGHGAHLGGSATGVLYFVFFLRRRLRQLRSREKRVTDQSP
jgi:rhomboid-like protein